MLKGQGGGVGPSGLSIGGGFLGGPTENFSADVGEPLVFTSVLSDADRMAVESYVPFGDGLPFAAGAEKALALGGQAAVPEPGSLASLALLLSRRRRPVR